MTGLHFAMLGVGVIIGFSAAVLFWAFTIPDSSPDHDDFWND